MVNQIVYSVSGAVLTVDLWYLNFDKVLSQSVEND